MIQNYIFDFGDVFINLDKASTTRELVKLGMTTFTEEMRKQNQLYEKGLISTAEFLTFYQKQFPNTTPKQLRDAWNKILLDFPLYRLHFIEEFSKTHTCYLLSNINEMHLYFIKNQLGNKFYNRFYSCFKKVYYTHEIHLRKPDKNIFEYVFKDARITPDTCFFIDDTKENTDRAESLGILSWNIDPKTEDIVNLQDKLTEK